MSKKLLVVAPHPDDEVLGMGGTMALRSANGWAVHVLVVTRGTLPLFGEEEVSRARAELARAHDILGVATVEFLDFPAAELDTVPRRELNARIGGIVSQCAPDELYLPFVGDIHFDHQVVFAAGLVAARPHRRRPPAGVYAYETMSETNWNAPFLSPAFVPNHFVDISGVVERKMRAVECFASQLYPPPHERSTESVRALALLRGATVGASAAEAFVTVRTVS
jgi:LmbE family N-acetylglucosaminyl deacetylase